MKFPNNLQIHEAYDEADIRQIVCAETFDNRHHKPGIEIAGIEASIKMAEVSLLSLRI